MKVLLTGTNGYIGMRLLPLLLERGHEVYALLRNKKSIQIPSKFTGKLHLIQGDLLYKDLLEEIPNDIEIAYYLVHSMNTTSGNFSDLETLSAINFRDRMAATTTRQIIYLSGIVNDNELSHHLASRKNVGSLLSEGKVPVTTLMAGIIIGSGSISFEIIRDLIEKLPIMIAPKWTSNLTQPIAIQDVLEYLLLVLDHPECTNKSFEIGGLDILSYKELLLSFARIRGLKRFIISVPLLTPKLSSYWIYFITSASYRIARALIESLKNNAICKENTIQKIFPKKLLSFEEAVKRSFHYLEEDDFPSSWKEPAFEGGSSLYVQVPHFGVLFNTQVISLSIKDISGKEEIWSRNLNTGWPYIHWFGKKRAIMDRDLQDPSCTLKFDDTMEFWKILLTDSRNYRLVIYAKRNFLGEAWIEFRIIGQIFYQTVTFRPLGLLGRLYWYGLYPFHYIFFRNRGRSFTDKFRSS